jgi:hypothetical protein
MKFTFGIITGTQVPIEVIKSINNLNIPEYEIVVVGGENQTYYVNVNHIPFDENLGAYTVKKNLITKNSKYENIVYTHDYFIFDRKWYNGFEKFGNDWDICMNVIQNKDGSRFRDWCVWDDPTLCYDENNHRVVLAPYDYKKIIFMYISGSYWVAKKHVMETEPLDETIDWGSSEDVEWSKRVLPKYSYKMNTHSIVKSLKDKRLSAKVL